MHALHNTKRIDATMRNIKEVQGDSRDMWHAVDRAMGTTTTSFTYAHTADAFADLFTNKIAAIRLETASAPTPTYAATLNTILRCFSDVQHAHVIEMIGYALYMNSEVLLLAGANPQSDLQSSIRTRTLIYINHY